MRIVPLLLVLLSAAPAAAQPARAGAAREFIVEGSGGGFEVTLSPTFVTVFYLPEDIQRAIASDQRNFSVSVAGKAVAVQPVANPKAKRENLNLDTKTLHISIILNVGSDTDAVSQVVFKRKDDVEAFEQRVEEEVEKRLAPIRAELETKRGRVEADADTLAWRKVSRALLQRFATRELNVSARFDRHVVVHVSRLSVIGERAYVHLTVQNREDVAFHLRDIRPKQGGGADALFEADATAEARGAIATIAPAATRAAIVSLPLDERRFELILTPTSGDAITLPALALE